MFVAPIDQIPEPAPSAGGVGVGGGGGGAVGSERGGLQGGGDEDDDDDGDLLGGMLGSASASAAAQVLSGGGGGGGGLGGGLGPVGGSLATATPTTAPAPAQAQAAVGNSDNLLGFDDLFGGGIGSASSGGVQAQPAAPALSLLSTATCSPQAFQTKWGALSARRQEKIANPMGKTIDVLEASLKAKNVLCMAKGGGKGFFYASVSAECRLGCGGGSVWVCARARGHKHTDKKVACCHSPVDLRFLGPCRGVQTTALDGCANQVNQGDSSLDTGPHFLLQIIGGNQSLSFECELRSAAEAAGKEDAFVQLLNEAACS